MHASEEDPTMTEAQPAVQAQEAVPAQPVDAPLPDPGNAPPSQWTEDLSPEEIAQVEHDLQQEHPENNV